MQIYLPIAEMSVNALLILGMGAAVGFLSGLFGVGGGFLLTPLLIFAGIPPAVAVATQVNQIVASSVSGVIAHWRRKSVDFMMGGVLVAGGIAGSTVGILIFKSIQKSGHTDLFVSLSYVVLLGAVGTLMLYESLRVIRTARGGQKPAARHSGQHVWIHGLPFKVRFRRSKLYISVLGPLGIGFFVGTLVTVLGIGGGFIMIPAMIYILRMPTNVVVGTSLFQAIFVTGLATILHAVSTQSVDAVLAALLIGGGVIGAQYGARTGQKLQGEELRALLGGLVLLVALRLAVDLVSRPADLYSTIPILHEGTP